MMMDVKCIKQVAKSNVKLKCKYLNLSGNIGTYILDKGITAVAGAAADKKNEKNCVPFTDYISETIHHTNR